MVFCGHCHRAMNGQYKKGFRYYRHANGCTNCLGGIVRADDLEERVIPHLFETFGNPAALKRAIEEATPNREKVEEIRKRLGVIGVELKKIGSGRDRILRLIASDDITDADAKDQLGKMKQRETRYQEEQERLEVGIQNIPSPAMYNEQRLASAKLWAMKGRADDFGLMTWEEKRKLAQTVFAGLTLDGNRMGVYVVRIAEGNLDELREDGHERLFPPLRKGGLGGWDKLVIEGQRSKSESLKKGKTQMFKTATSFCFSCVEFP